MCRRRGNLRVAAPERAALHRGVPPKSALTPVSGSPPLSGRPFIEAPRPTCCTAWASWSPPLSGRPFIEAPRPTCCTAWAVLVAAPERAALHRGTTTNVLYGVGILVAAPERAALHRGVIGTDRPAEGQIDVAAPDPSWARLVRTSGCVDGCRRGVPGRTPVREFDLVWWPGSGRPFIACDQICCSFTCANR